MNEILNVIHREYITRIRKKSFIVITLLTSFLLSFLFILPVLFGTQNKDYQPPKIGLIDTQNSFKAVLNESGLFIERIENKTEEDIKGLVLTDKWDGILYIEKSDSIKITAKYYSRKKVSAFLINQIKSTIQKVVINDKLSYFGVENPEEFINSIKNSVLIESFAVSDETIEKGNTIVQQILSIVLGTMIYIFIFLFASQVMHGVLEEKSSKIVELIITSISPVKFMTGKILGIALLGLTQIICIVVIIYGVILFFYNFSETATNSFFNQNINPDDLSQLLNSFNLIDFSVIIPAFVFFFLGGYLLYSSIFAAVAAVANHENDVQQTILIVTIPLILSIFVLTKTVISPNNLLSYWFSIIPFTSPIVMMGRVVQGAPISEILLSMLLLVMTTVGIIILSGKVYRTAILYTGKKVSLRDVLSWIGINK